MSTQVLIARHGNTFRPDETPRRVGARTDLPLVEKDRSYAIGQYLKAHFQPDVIFCSPLLRTKQTAEFALEASGLDIEVIYDDRFIELDYGPDENKEESEVIARIGQEAMDLWNSQGVVPAGWDVDILGIRQAWSDFFNMIEQDYSNQKCLVVTSNGTARFAPEALKLKSDKIASLKMKTGNLSLFQLYEMNWNCVFWDKAPKDL